jgi:hypothetical protein
MVLTTGEPQPGQLSLSVYAWQWLHLLIRLLKLTHLPYDVQAFLMNFPVPLFFSMKEIA